MERRHEDVAQALEVARGELPRHALADAGPAGHHRKAVLDPPQEIGDQRRGEEGRSFFEFCQTIPEHGLGPTPGRRCNEHFAGPRWCPSACPRWTTCGAASTSPDDRARLLAEVERLRPRLVVLDPFVRLHRIDENTASEVAPLLAYLRELQRTLGCAVALVHHARKGGHARAGQALRGSSELHAWGDSNLYLRRDGERLLLSIEHRAAASSSGLELELAESRRRAHAACP
ncbi:MAG: AAA family ATPase [Methylotenera sp.]